MFCCALQYSMLRSSMDNVDRELKSTVVRLALPALLPLLLLELVANFLLGVRSPGCGFCAVPCIELLAETSANVLLVALHPA